MPGGLLSKSKFMNGLQCPKLLWLNFNDPARVPEPDASTLHIFDQGHLVGELAKKLFPDGISVPYDDFRGNLRETRELLKNRRPLFEAGFFTGKLFSRLDILNPAGLHEWDIVEVKSTTGVKEENIHDVAFQKLCAEMCGVNIHKCYLAFINNHYVKHGEIDPSQFFILQDITEEVLAVSGSLEDRISAMLETMSSGVCPDIPVGSYCTHPYPCPVVACWEELAGTSIFDLYRGGKKRFDLFYAGIFNIKDIPAEYKLNNAQQIQKECEISSLPHIEKAPLRDFLSTLQPPLHYLDFETINPAVPLFDGVRPYQRIPFQFSLHIAGPRNSLYHHSFLAEGTEDPRPQFLQRLIENILPSGSIVTYNQSFEEGVLKELALAFPEYSAQVENIRSRLVDLLKPFQNFHYYHPLQNGSASIKSVLPALTGEGYSGMAIADGDTASRAFLQVTYGDSSEEARRQTRADLEKYCGLDTAAMLRIVEKLREIAEAKNHNLPKQFSLFNS